MHLQTSGTFKSTNHKKDWVRKSAGDTFASDLCPVDLHRHVTEKILNSNAFFPTILLLKANVNLYTLAGLNIRGSSRWLVGVV